MTTSETIEQPGFDAWLKDLDKVAEGHGFERKPVRLEQDMAVWRSLHADGKTPQEAWSAVPVTRRGR